MIIVGAYTESYPEMRHNDDPAFDTLHTLMQRVASVAYSFFANLAQGIYSFTHSPSSFIEYQSTIHLYTILKNDKPLNFEPFTPPSLSSVIQLHDSDPVLESAIDHFLLEIEEIEDDSFTDLEKTFLGGEDPKTLRLQLLLHSKFSSDTLPRSDRTAPIPALKDTEISKKECPETEQLHLVKHTLKFLKLVRNKERQGKSLTELERDLVGKLPRETRELSEKITLFTEQLELERENYKFLGKVNRKECRRMPLTDLEIKLLRQIATRGTLDQFSNLPDQQYKKRMTQLWTTVRAGLAENTPNLTGVLQSPHETADRMRRTFEDLDASDRKPSASCPEIKSLAEYAAMREEKLQRRRAEAPSLKE